MNTTNEHVFGIVLAGGEGQRLQEFIKERTGTTRPKQYTTLTGTRTMLRHTLDRIEKLVPIKHVFTVVNRKHLAFALETLSDHEKKYTLVLPVNKETAASIVVPLVQINQQDRSSIVAIFPSDHFIIEEEKFMRYVEDAVGCVQTFPECAIILGVQPHVPEPEYGWIEVQKNFLHCGGNRFYNVVKFWEKPDAPAAQKLFDAGALWNSMVIVAKSDTLMRLVRKTLPQVYDPLVRFRMSYGATAPDPNIELIFQRLPAMNFSKHVLEQNSKYLRVLRMEGVYWNDWGKKERILADLSRFGQ
ncbi:MAG: sugar phosphate nucleotidyltransferase [bacterium]